MKILITGGSGFIGSHIVECYQNKADIVVLDNLTTGSRDNLKNLCCEIVEGSIEDDLLLGGIMRGVDVVFHLAALVSVSESIEKPLETSNINANGTIRVLEAARKHGVKKLCFASTSAVYGEREDRLKTESLMPDPRSPYSISKLSGEYYCELYRRSGWLPTVILRFFNVFGPKQDPNNNYAAVISAFFDRARQGLPIIINGDGEQTRDFVYVKDVVQAMSLVAELEGAEGIYNVGYGSDISINKLANVIISITGSSSTIKYAGSRPGDIRHSMADSSRLRKIGWLPSYDLTSGITEMNNSQLY